MPPSPETVRAAVPRDAVETIAERSPAADVVAIEELDDLGGIAFVVPVPYRQADLAKIVRDLPDLRVIQTLSAGVDGLEGAVPDRVTLCSARGARDGAVAEWIVGALLGASTHLLEAARAGRAIDRLPLDDVAGSTVLIVGMGSIGEATKRRLEPFGATVVGVGSRAHDDVRGVDELPDLLPGADAVIVLTPLTDDTRGLFDATMLGRMRDGALLVNAARGAVVVTDDLLAETNAETPRLRAVLDVTDPEPLPDDHPLWRAPGVLAITPHIAGNSPRAQRLAVELAGDQLARFCAGEPLRNVVDRGV